MRRGLAFALLTAVLAAGVLSAALLVASPSAVADTGTTGTTTAPPPPIPTTPVPTTPTPPRPATIPAGVTIAGSVLVGGLSPAEATEAVKAFFAQPLLLELGKVKLRVSPKKLGASAYVGDAVKRARISAPGANVPLKVKAPQPRIKRYVKTLAKRFDRKPVEAKLLLRKGKPVVTKDRPGRRVQQTLVMRDLFRAVKTHTREPIALRLQTLQPETKRSEIGYVIVIKRGQNKLYLYKGGKLTRTFGVATGQARYPTPLGKFEIIVKWRNPWWYPPASDWAKDAKPIPPGPGNPLGTRWMGISSPAVGIHGTPDAASIGYSVSHGCIRMHIPDVEWLFNQVEIGTPVYILP